MDWRHIFDLPKSCTLDMAITKVSLKSHHQIILSESRLLDGADIQSIRLIGAVTQRSANIEPFVNNQESYLEVYFIVVQIAAEAYQKTYKPISRLLHKLIPHHCIIITQTDNGEKHHISLHTKLIHQQRADMRVLHKEIITPTITKDTPTEFFEQLAFNAAQRTNLKAFYNHYIQVMQNYLLAEVTQEFKMHSVADTEEKMKLYDQYYEYETAINTKTKELHSATQMSEKVACNTEIHKLKQSMQKIRNKL